MVGSSPFEIQNEQKVQRCAGGIQGRQSGMMRLLRCNRRKQISKMLPFNLSNRVAVVVSMLSDTDWNFKGGRLFVC